MASGLLSLYVVVLPIRILYGKMPDPDWESIWYVSSRDVAPVALPPAFALVAAVRVRPTHSLLAGALLVIAPLSALLTSFAIW